MSCYRYQSIHILHCCLGVGVDVSLSLSLSICICLYVCVCMAVFALLYSTSASTSADDSSADDRQSSVEKYSHIEGKHKLCCVMKFILIITIVVWDFFRNIP